MEIEFKFQIPPDRLASLQSAIEGPGSTRTHLRARYFDTPDAALSAHAIALRLRKEGPHWVQTAKALGDGPVQRLEHNVALDMPHGAEPSSAQPGRHAGTPVGERLAKVLDASAAPLVEVYGTDIWRLARHVQHGASRIELALDTGDVLAPSPQGGAPRRAAVCELELELLDGSVADLASLAAAWATRHGLWLSTVTKSERGMRLARGGTFEPTAQATAAAEATVVPQAIVTACLAQILPPATEVADGNGHAAHLDALQKGLHHLCTALHHMAPASQAMDAGWLPALSGTLGALACATPVQASHAVRAASFQAALVGLIGFAASDPA